jgi:hypothetical protein
VAGTRPFTSKATPSSEGKASGLMSASPTCKMGIAAKQQHTASFEEVGECTWSISLCVDWFYLDCRQ